jgi:hypothetical protein
MEGKGKVPPKAKPHDKEVIRCVEKARPGAKATEPTFEAIIDAILGADADKVREHQKHRRKPSVIGKTNTAR